MPDRWISLPNGLDASVDKTPQNLICVIIKKVFVYVSEHSLTFAEEADLEGAVEKDLPRPNIVSLLS